MCVCVFFSFPFVISVIHLGAYVHYLSKRFSLALNRVDHFHLILRVCLAFLCHLQSREVEKKSRLILCVLTKGKPVPISTFVFSFDLRLFVSN